MLRLARTAALVCCDREIGGMAKRQVWAVSTYVRSHGLCDAANLNSDPIVPVRFDF
jgi:hypothetical protein